MLTRQGLRDRYVTTLLNSNQSSRAGKSGGGECNERGVGWGNHIYYFCLKKTATEKLPTPLIRRALQTSHRDLF